jgi:DNA-binding CsgD family transcriptional regulator
LKVSYGRRLCTKLSGVEPLDASNWLIFRDLVHFVATLPTKRVRSCKRRQKQAVIVQVWTLERKMGEEQKLKTMNEVSIAEAVELFKKALSPDDYGEKIFPTNIAAKDFLECLRLYELMIWSRIPNEWGHDWPIGADFTRSSHSTVQTLTYDGEKLAELEIPEEVLKQFSPTEREYLNVMKREAPRVLTIKELAHIFGVSRETAKTHMSAVCQKVLGVGGGGKKTLVEKLRSSKLTR